MACGLMYFVNKEFKLGKLSIYFFGKNPGVFRFVTLHFRTVVPRKIALPLNPSKTNRKP